MLRQHLEQIKVLEQEVSEWDVKFARREEFWQKRYNDQVKIIFGLRGEKKDDVIEGKKEGVKARKEEGGVGNEIYLVEVTQKNQEIEKLKKYINEVDGRNEELAKKIGSLEGSLSMKEGDINRIGRFSKDLKNEEAERLAVAAQKTIQTLQLIISDKNKENERYEFIKEFLDKILIKHYCNLLTKFISNTCALLMNIITIFPQL